MYVLILAKLLLVHFVWKKKSVGWKIENKSMDNDFKVYIADHQIRVAIFRGHIINYVTLIENELENFIAEYFIKDENEILFFKNLFLTGESYTFSNKIRIFEKILKNKFNNMYDESLIKDINNKRKLRNNLAHYNIRTIEQNKKSDSLFFSTIESGSIKYVEYTHNDTNDLINNTYDTLKNVKKIHYYFERVNTL